MEIIPINLKQTEQNSSPMEIIPINLKQTDPKKAKITLESDSIYYIYLSDQPNGNNINMPQPMNIKVKDKLLNSTNSTIHPQLIKPNFKVNQ